MFSRMRRLDLDFQRARPAAGWAGWALLAASVAFTLDLGRAHHAAQEAVALYEERLARAGPAARPAPAPAASAQDVAAARETIRRLATPWGALFTALESAQTEGVALLAVAPDPQSASVVITGEARDYEALLRYLAALRRTPPLARAYLARHDARAAPSALPLGFTIRAPWGLAR